MRRWSAAKQTHNVSCFDKNCGIRRSSLVKSRLSTGGTSLGLVGLRFFALHEAWQGIW